MGRNGRSKTHDKEHSRTQELSHENKKLKREIDRLRKTMLRPQTEFCQNCLENETAAEIEREKPQLKPVVAKDRTCHNCRINKLELVQYSKGADLWYIRICPGCKHKTPGKRWNDKVEP